MFFQEFLLHLFIYRHSLAQQKVNEENSLPTVVPTPIKKISVPSYPSSINGSSVYNNTNHQHQYHHQHSYPTGSVGDSNNGGSDSNLSRSYHGSSSQQPYVINNCGVGYEQRNVEYSMRKQLLRRLWSKDVKTISRPSSLSPPSRRTTPPSRRSGLNFDPSSPVLGGNNGASASFDPTLHPCEECQRLGVDRNAASDSKRLRLQPGRSLDSSIIKPKSSPLSDSSRPASNSSPPTASSSDRMEAESEANKKHEQQIRKSVLIYMTSLDKANNDNENGGGGGGNGANRNNNNEPPTNTNLKSEKSEESVDSGNGEATQNLDNLTSSSDTDAMNNIKNNNHKSASNHSESDQDENRSHSRRSNNNSTPTPSPQEVRQAMEDQYVAQLLISNLEANGVEVKTTHEQSYDHENNLMTLQQTTTLLHRKNDDNIEEVQYNELVRTDAAYDDQSTANSYRIMSQSSDGHIQDVIVHDGTISYFPSYSLVESRGDMSSYTSQCSEPEPEPLSAVASGSAYPDLDFPYQVVVTRLSAVPRTMSMEVQPSSTSAEEEVEPEYDSGDDDTVSLVDSLDDPLSPRPQRKKGPRKSAEAFFVPIADASVDDEHLVVSDAMPDKLKERLDSRQKRRDQKKQHETKVKVRAVQRIVERRVSDPNDRTSRKENVPLNKGKSRPPRDSSTSSTGEFCFMFTKNPQRYLLRR